MKIEATYNGFSITSGDDDDNDDDDSDNDDDDDQMVLVVVASNEPASKSSLSPKIWNPFSPCVFAFFGQSHM